jgi:hypothetical protein
MKAVNNKSDRVLLSVARLVDFGGSEIVTLELAEAFDKLGWNVSVATFEVGDEINGYLKLIHADVYDLSSASPFPIEVYFDLVWMHHSVTAYDILLNKNILIHRAVFSSLSHFEPIESPPLSMLPVDLYLVHSQENFKYFEEHYPLFFQNTKIFPNPCPLLFWKKNRKRNKRLGLIALISNHIPPELNDLTCMLREVGIIVDIYGFQGRRVRVTPDIIKKYDCVITIGKTVQYCIAMKTPVFCYDRFGGDGWLNEENLRINMEHNFSGRGSRGRVDASILFREILDGYDKSINEIRKIHFCFKDRLVLECSVEMVVSYVMEKPKRCLKNICYDDFNLLIRQNKIYRNRFI